MRIGICDDDKTWCNTAEDILDNFFEQLDREAEIFCFSSEKDLMSYQGIPLDLLFLDIQLGRDMENGISLAVKINEKWGLCQIVYLTNYLFYATEVYNTEHIYFVLKEQFEEKLPDLFRRFFYKTEQRERKLFFTLIGNEKTCLAPEEILYFERSKRTTVIVSKWGNFSTWEKISDLEKRLPEFDFVKCHSSYIVYLPAVRSLRKNEFVMENDVHIMISRSHERKVKEHFMKWAILYRT